MLESIFVLNSTNRCWYWSICEPQWSVSCVALHLVLAFDISSMKWFDQGMESSMFWWKNFSKLIFLFLSWTYLFSNIFWVLNIYFLFYFAMKGHPVELRAEFHQFEPFRIVSSVFSCCIARDSRAAFFSSSRWSAFGAFQCDNDANAFAFGHNDSFHF